VTSQGEAWGHKVSIKIAYITHACVYEFLETLVEICDFATNEFVTSCDYLTFTTTVGYICNY